MTRNPTRAKSKNPKPDLSIHGIGSGERVGVVFPTLRGGAEGGGSAQPQRGGRVGADPDYKGGRVGAVSSKKISHHPQNLFDYICNKVTRQFNLL